MAKKEYSLIGLRFDGDPGNKARGAVIVIVILVAAALVFKCVEMVKKWKGGDGAPVQVQVEPSEARDSLLSWLRGNFGDVVTEYSLVETLPMRGVGEFTDPDHATVLRWYRLYQELDDIASGSRSMIEFERDKALKEREEADSTGRVFLDEKLRVLQMMLVDRTRRRDEVGRIQRELLMKLDEIENSVDGLLVRADVTFSDSLTASMDYVMDERKRIALLKFVPRTEADSTVSAAGPLVQGKLNNKKTIQ